MHLVGVLCTQDISKDKSAQLAKEITGPPLLEQYERDPLTGVPL